MTSVAPQSIGRYLLCDEIASGGMASVHLGRVVGPAGFSRTVAIKKMHPHHASEPEFAAMFLDEARLAARIHHPNVVATLDVVARGRDLFIVMEYVEGETLARLSRASLANGSRVPQRIALAVISGALSGLHAAHTATGERREPLAIVHRDVSPQNLLVGVDGVPRVLDFGIAKAAARLGSTRGGQVKGKLRYMSPEQIRREPLDARTDLYATGVVLWEVLTGRRLFDGEDPGAILHEILTTEPTPPSRHASDVPPELDAVVLRALARDPKDRFASALEMAEAIERAAALATPREVGAWVESLARETLSQRANRIAELESSESVEVPELVPLPSRRTRADDPTAVEAAGATRTTAVPTPAPRATRVWIGAGVLVALALVFAVVMLPRLRAEPAPASSERVPAAVPAAVPEAALPSTPSPSGSSPAEVKSAEAPIAPLKPASVRTSGKAPPADKKKAGCTPPYVIEADGTKRYKPECL